MIIRYVTCDETKNIVYSIEFLGSCLGKRKLKNGRKKGLLIGINSRDGIHYTVRVLRPRDLIETWESHEIILC